MNGFSKFLPEKLMRPQSSALLYSFNTRCILNLPLYDQSIRKNKPMKKYFLTGLAVTLISVCVNAQNPDAGKRKNTMRPELKKEIGLSNAQAQQMMNINNDMKTRAQGIRHDQSLSNAEKKDRLRALKMERKRRMKNLLTHEQRKRMRAFRRNHSNPSPGRFRHRRKAI